MTTLLRTCGQTAIPLSGVPILAVDCCCTGCRAAATRLQALPGVAGLPGAHFETPFGHWLGVYGRFWPPETRPRTARRSLASDLQDRAALAADIPSSRTQSPGFMWARLTAWVTMRFRGPVIAVIAAIAVTGDVDA